jgi:class 3 adenylate cyclase/tetratricopeptide (TPR) repeat protein
LAAGDGPIRLSAVSCPNCGTENPAGQRFCGSCGTALAQTCGSCGAANPPGQRFCGNCGTALATTAPASAPASTPAAERRLVSVLFADLVGFTTLSESRDAEEVRELLSRYFDTCRRLIELYGGTVEKFIGDAVMAVWGTPVATEDDAERAVRAALDLVTAVGALGEELGAENLKARAGVLTGEAAVTLGATGQGMVAGDLVNTASRVQSVAEPGTVVVGEATRRAAEQTVVFEDAGSFELKGKDGETPLWRALRVVSGRLGSLKSQGLEAPFVGRDRELRQIKELFHSTADERRAQLVSVTGIAGIGKSRLSWEFYKYFDGIEQIVYWHRGRCLAYGDGVTYWALADMVRMRCGIAEDEEPETAVQKLRATLDEHLLDAEDREYVEPRLAQLLGLGEHETRERQDLFGAWRLFFERLSDVYPTVLAFEDMQWADSSLLDFIEYLLEWSRNSPILVITLARPDLVDRRPTWGAGHRNFASLYLEPLSEPAMQELLAGLVPGLPQALRDQILARAEGIPLYAVETVRMLLDRKLLAEDGASYRVVGEVESLAIPETLQALAAARLDSLSADERRIVQDAAVLGKTFTLTALGALTGLGRDDLEPVLAGLVRKELLGLQVDPRSPEHGQYGFLQDLIRQVAYDTLAKRDRRDKHLAAAEHLADSLAEEEVAEVVASHLVEAYRLDPDAEDAAELRGRARRALISGAERAAALGANEEAGRFFTQAAELASSPADEAAALTRAGEMVHLLGRTDEAESLYRRASALYMELGETHGVARLAAMLGYVALTNGRSEEAERVMREAYETVKDDEPDADVALLSGRLAQLYAFSGDARAAELVDRTLDIAEGLQLHEAMLRGWGAKAVMLFPTRPTEAFGLFMLTLSIAREHDMTRSMAVAYGNVNDAAMQRDLYRDCVGYLEEALPLARRIGDRRNEWFMLAEQSYVLSMLGRWDEAVARASELPGEFVGTDIVTASVLTGVAEIHIRRGQLVVAQELLGRFDAIARSDDVQMHGSVFAATSAVRLAEGRMREALAAAERAIEGRQTLGLGSQDVKQGFRNGLEAALALGDLDSVNRLLRIVEDAPVGLRPPYLAALAQRFRARLAGDAPEADRLFASAAGGFAAIDVVFEEAVVQLEHAEWLSRIGRPGEAEQLVARARETFERLGATPWLERAAAAEPIGVD